MTKSVSLFLALAIAFIAAGAAAGAAKSNEKIQAKAEKAPPAPAEKVGIVQKMIEGDNSFAVILNGPGGAKDVIVINLDDAAANSDKALRLQDSLLEKHKVRVTVDAKNTILDVQDY